MIIAVFAFLFSVCIWFFLTVVVTVLFPALLFFAWIDDCGKVREFLIAYGNLLLAPFRRKRKADAP